MNSYLSAVLKQLEEGTFDIAGHLLSTVDARGQQLHCAYDLLGRKNAARQDSPTGTTVSTWLFDTVDKGQLTSITRRHGALAYTSAIGSYDDAYRPESTTNLVASLAIRGPTRSWCLLFCK